MSATVETAPALSVPCPLSRCGAAVGHACRLINPWVSDRIARPPHQIRRAAASLAAPEIDPCEACNAEPGESCRPGCLGYALAMGEL